MFYVQFRWDHQTDRTLDRFLRSNEVRGSKASSRSRWWTLPVAVTKVVSLHFIHSGKKIPATCIHHDLPSAEHVRSIAIWQHGAGLLLDKEDAQPVISGLSHGDKESSYYQWRQPD